MGVVKNIIFVIVAIALIGALEWYGLIGFIIFFLGITLYKIWKGRQMFADTVMHAESRIFGKPLSKKYWKKGEMKNTKIKVVWGKKNGSKKTSRK